MIIDYNYRRPNPRIDSLTPENYTEHSIKQEKQHSPSIRLMNEGNMEYEFYDHRLYIPTDGPTPDPA
jgi:hypothetical protein